MFYASEGLDMWFIGRGNRENGKKETGMVASSTTIGQPTPFFSSAALLVLVHEKQFVLCWLIGSATNYCKSCDHFERGYFNTVGGTREIDG